MWYLNATRAGLRHGVWEPPLSARPQHDHLKGWAKPARRTSIFIDGGARARAARLRRQLSRPARGRSN
jgi:hypothetical protein